ncbi:MAG TPA: aminotransferase class V-fold PLP-dependent enzyme [Candidatus Kapabacteria bacterium]|nr:aminotransferase class V-fold PLP-dependent enzyme [Candidatus Kapabacteria bacterium]
MKSQFLLNPEITFLNHGSFGACPKPIFENYQYWQLELEKEPVQFIQKNSAQYLKTSKDALANYIGCSSDDFFYTTNPTVAVNTVLRSLNLEEGDEVLTTNHEYGAMDRTWSYFSKKKGIKYIRQNISLPILSKEQILDEFWSGYTSKTKIIFISHISSVTALVFPVKEICEKARELGLITIIDGAHVPGQLDLNIQELNPDFYTGALHKWLLAPKGVSFLYVKKTFQNSIDPLVVSWGYESESPSDSQFLDYHQHQGTRDISAFLTIPKAIEFLRVNNWEERAASCRKLIRDNYNKFCELLNSKPICPVTSEFLVQMCSIPIQTTKPLELKETLFHKYKIEIPVMKLEDKFFLRIAINVYNSQQDLEILQEALEDIIENSDLINLG